MMSWEKLCNHQIRCCMKWFSVIVKSFQMLKTAIFISDYSIVCSTVEHTCSLWGTSHFLRKDPSWKLLMRQAVQEASVPITCAPITFTKMEMFECSKMDTAAGGLVAKQLQAMVAASGLAAMGCCTLISRQMSEAGMSRCLPDSGTFSSATHFQATWLWHFHLSTAKVSECRIQKSKDSASLIKRGQNRAV